MSNISEIQELAEKLNLQNLAHGDIDITRDKEAQLVYLKSILQKEYDLREQAALVKREKLSRIPTRDFQKEKLNSGVAWQVERLESLDWINDDQNLLLIGKCATGKTSLVTHLSRKALASGLKVSYNTFDDFMYTITHKSNSDKQIRRYRFYLSCSLIIIDDMMYTGITSEELTAFYHTMMLLNETRSIVLITNRELSAWVEAAEDKHLMQTLIDRLTANCQIIRLG